MKAFRTLTWLLLGLTPLAMPRINNGQSVSLLAPHQQTASEDKPSAQPPSPRRLTLQDALALARKNSTQFQAALTNASLARQDRFQARASLLPAVTFDNSAIYTQEIGRASCRERV